MIATRPTGVILAGGKGERMGAFKPLLSFRDRPLIAYTIDALAPLCDEILVMAGPQHGAALSRVANAHRGDTEAPQASAEDRDASADASARSIRGGPSVLRDVSAPPLLRGECPVRVFADPSAGPHVALALAARVAQGDALLVAPADAPFLTRAVFEALLARAPNAVAREGRGVNPLVACYRRADLLAATAAPVRSLQDVAARLGAVAVDIDARLLADVDTPDALRAADRA